MTPSVFRSLLAIAPLCTGLTACASSDPMVYRNIPPPFTTAPTLVSGFASDSPTTYTGTPQPRFTSEAIAAPSPPPSFRRPSVVDAEQQRTTERLAAQRRGSAPQVAPPAPAALGAVPTFTTTLHDSGMAPGQYDGGGIPPMPQARPGECFALVRTPDQYRSVQQSYVARPASERIEVAPARYQSATETVVTQEAYERLEVVPPVFRTVIEPVEITPATVRYVSTEPEYDMVTERVMESPARMVWKPGRGPMERIDHATGQILCLVEEPAVYKTITRRVQRRPSEVREVVVPGQFRNVSRKVMERPAEVRRVAVPAQTTQLPVQRLLAPARVSRVAVPEEMATLTVRELAAPSRLEWRPVLCETNLTPQVIRQVQEALHREGFDPGPIDGRIGPRTVRAMNAFQRGRNLPEDRYLNLATLSALGVR